MLDASFYTTTYLSRRSGEKRYVERGDGAVGEKTVGVFGQDVAPSTRGTEHRWQQQLYDGQCRGKGGVGKSEPGQDTQDTLRESGQAQRYRRRYTGAS